jgi:hypothetical protein
MGRAVAETVGALAIFREGEESFVERAEGGDCGG